PEGIGLLHTTPELRARLRVGAPGWTSIVDEGDAFRVDLAADPSGRRLEAGATNLGGIGGLGAAVELLQGAGVGAIWDHVDRWCQQLVDGLEELGATVCSDRAPARRSAIVAATFDGADPVELADRLVAHGVVVAAWHGALRFSPHGWNDVDDLAATLHAVRRATRR
ncbi:MAG TPA: aminotransferase class V-fold PLP-dependent enzyme, partial [Aquihabitans sp.]|nr:aminotransferase class V-fold PLP-dependent enzyme [Aquihabitans sp.]